MIAFLFSERGGNGGRRLKEFETGKYRLRFFVAAKKVEEMVKSSSVGFFAPEGSLFLLTRL